MTAPRRRTTIRRDEDVQARRNVIYAFLSVVLVATLALTSLGYFWHENNHRINEIQEARVASCKRTYAGIKEVFQPFFPVDANGDPLPGVTAESLANYRKFTRTIDRLQKGCNDQTRVSKEEEQA